MQKPIVSIVMGSDSDLPIMKDAAEIMEKFNIRYEILILSAHRSPDETANYAKGALKRGIKVIIAGAGGAAHLAGVIAAYFPLPVIGVPIKTSALNGVDSLYSIIQMPPGIPVATVAINGAKNAALLAIQILAVNDKKLEIKMIDYKKNLEKKVIEKSKKLNQLGVKKYLVTLKK
jgi:5-(carboxyamino)imidazole ribonucleotide mutase